MYCIFYVYKSFCRIRTHDLAEVESVVLYPLGSNVTKLDKTISMSTIPLTREYPRCDVLLSLTVIITACGGPLKQSRPNY